MSDVPLTPATGAVVYIGDYRWTHDTLAAYDGESGWEEVGGLESIPEFGIKWETGSFTPLKTGVKRKFKTTQDNGTMALTAARDTSDAGQIAAMAAAADKKNTYPIKIVLNDAPEGTGAKPSRFYFRALVTSATVNPGSTADTVKTSITLDIDTDIIDGNPVAGTP